MVMQRLSPYLNRSVRTTSRLASTAACPAQDSQNVEALRMMARSKTHLYDTKENINPIFNPKLYADTRKPLLSASPLPGHCYTSPEWYEREIETIFRPNWNLVGRADEIPNPGDYITLNSPGIGPIVVIRSRNGEDINAYVNICRHRGALLLSEDAGNARRGITCPYHAWTYDPSDGKLKGAPRMKNNCSKAFNKDKFPLHPVRLEEKHGFLFVSSTLTKEEDQTSLDESTGNVWDLILDQWPLDKLVTVARADYDVQCNWKFLLENTSETYHTSYVHKATLGAMDSKPGEALLHSEPIKGDWSAVYVPGERSVVPMKKEAAPFPSFQDKTFFVSLFPSLQINVTHDCVWWMRMMPTGVDSTKVTQGFLFPKSTTEMENFDELLKPYLNRWKLAVVEDNEISENQQLGASAAEASYPGMYADLEFGVHDFHNYLLDKVIGKDQA